MWEKISAIFISAYMGVVGFLMPSAVSEANVSITPTPTVVETTSTPLRVLTQDQITRFTEKAKEDGYTDSEIAREIKRKRTEVERGPTQPSERAYKIAAFVIVRLKGVEKREFFKRLVPSGKVYSISQGKVINISTDTEYIKLFALMMDKDPAWLAKNEALMQKDLIEEGKPIRNIYYEQPSSSAIDSVPFETDYVEQARQRQREQEKAKREQDIENIKREQEKAKREQENREFWENVCFRRGEQFNTLVGAGCR